MGEIDTKPVESVQAALSLFGHKNNCRRYRSTNGEDSKDGKERDLVLRDLASYKVQLEIKESAYKQVLLELEVYHKTTEELSSLLKKSESDREKYITENERARAYIDELESENKHIWTQLLHIEETLENIQCAGSEWRNSQEELIEELGAAEKSKFTALRRADLMGTSICLGKEKTEELLKHSSELNKAIFSSDLAAIKGGKQKSAVLLAKEAEVQMAAVVGMQVQKQMEEIRKQLDAAKDLESQLLEKSLVVDYLQSELAQAREFSLSTISNLNRLELTKECMEAMNVERMMYIESMEVYLERLQEELQNVRVDKDGLQRQMELARDEMQKAKNEMNEIREKEREMQIEMAMLRSELHRGRSKIATAEAAKARARSIKSGLYLAVQQLAMEAEEAKKDTHAMKQETERMKAAVENELATKDVISNADSSNICSGIMISVKEYDPLVRKAEEPVGVVDSPSQDALCNSTNVREVEALKEQLQSARAEIQDLRSAAERAVRRAKLAESAKVAVEDQLRKWREQKQRRRAALAALREEANHSSPACDKKPSIYQPLGKVLNMEF